MRDGDWSSDNPVQRLTARGFLDGVEFDVDGYSLTSEMTAALDPVESAGAPVTTGSVDWPQQQVVQQLSPQPFVRQGSWPPRQGQAFTLDVGDGQDQWWQQVIGYVDATSGKITEGSVSSSVVDLIDRLSRKVQRSPLLAAQPPNQPFPDGTPVDNYRRVQLYGIYITDMAARTAGFCATPPRTSDTILSAPCMGSTWPEVGQVVASAFFGTPSGPPQFRWSSWGAAVDHPDVTWLINGGRPSYAEVTVCLTEQGDCSLDVTRQETGVGLSIRHTAVDVIEVWSLSPGPLKLCSLARGESTRCAVAYQINTSDKTLAVTLRTDDGREVTATSAVGAPWDSSDAFPGCVRMYGAGAMGAVLVEHRLRSWESLAAPINADIRPGHFTRLVAMPTLDGTESVLSILSAQAKAECASMWLDSVGVLHWVGRDLLERASAVAVLSTDLDVDDLAWTDDLAGAREQVIITHRDPAVKRYLDFSVNLGDSQSVILNDSQVDEQWLDPGSDDWIQVDTELSYAGIGVRSVTTVNSYYGGTVAQNGTGPDTEVWASQNQISTTLEQVGYVYKLTRSADNIPAGRVLVTKVPPYSQGATSTFLAGKSLPLIRGKGLVSWVDVSITYDTGIAAPTITYDHQCGWYVQDPADLDNLAAWIVAKVSDSQPRINSVDIAYHPLLELGDKVVLTDPNRTGVEIDLVITGIRQGGGPSMSIGGRITRVTRPYDVLDPVNTWERLLAGWESAL